MGCPGAQKLSEVHKESIQYDFRVAVKNRALL